ALERRDRRPALLQELPRVHLLQDEPGHQGGVLHGNLFDHSSALHSVGATEAAATLAGERAGFAGTRSLNAAPHNPAAWAAPQMPASSLRSAARSASNGVWAVAAGLWLAASSGSEAHT